MPEKDLYAMSNQNRKSCERKGVEFNGNKTYNKASRDELLSASSQWKNTIEHTNNKDRNGTHYDHK